MQRFEVTNQKLFMYHLLKTNLFDSFEVHEVTLHIAFKLIIDGKRNHDYFEKTDSLTEFLGWSELRPYLYNLIQGNRLPTFFKIILSTTTPPLSVLYPNATKFFLNITFREKLMTCSTGVAYHEFILNKEADQNWDKRIEQFLLEHEFIK